MDAASHVIPSPVSAPVRVVYVIDADRRKGFAYGTLPGHPDIGEESFVVGLLDDGRSSPASVMKAVVGHVSLISPCNVASTAEGLADNRGCRRQRSLP